MMTFDKLHSYATNFMQTVSTLYSSQISALDLANIMAAKDGDYFELKLKDANLCAQAKPIATCEPTTTQFITLSDAAAEKAENAYYTCHSILVMAALALLFF